MRMIPQRLFGIFIYRVYMKNHFISRNNVKVPFTGDGVHYHQVSDHHREQEIFKVVSQSCKNN